MTDPIPQGYIKRTAGDLLVTATTAAERLWIKVIANYSERAALEKSIESMEAQDKETAEQAFKAHEAEVAARQAKRAQKHWLVRWLTPKRQWGDGCYTYSTKHGQIEKAQAALAVAKHADTVITGEWAHMKKWVDRLKALPPDAEVLISVEEMDLLRIAAEIAPTAEGKPT